MIDRLRRSASSRFKRAVFRFDGAFRLLGAEPDFVIVGTGRSGTGYISRRRSSISPATLSWMLS